MKSWHMPHACFPHTSALHLAQGRISTPEGASLMVRVALDNRVEFELETVTQVDTFRLFGGESAFLGALVHRWYLMPVVICLSVDDGYAY